LRISDEVFYLATKKSATDKKRKRTSNKTKSHPPDEEPLFNEDYTTSEPKNPPQSKPWGNDPDADDLVLDEKENVDLLETIDGIEYDPNQFKEDFPHLADELQGDGSSFSMDAVRWDEEAHIQNEILPSEEPNIESLLRRSKTEAEALEIINYFEKRGEISSQEASKFMSLLKSEGLNAFRRKRGKR